MGSKTFKNTMCSWFRYKYDRNPNANIKPPLKDKKLRARFPNSRDFWKLLRAREIFRYWDLENNKSPPQAEIFWGILRQKREFRSKNRPPGSSRK